MQWIVLLILSMCCYYIDSPSSFHRLLVSWRWPVILVLHPQEILCLTSADLLRGLVTPEWRVSAEEVDASNTALKAGRTWDTGGLYRAKFWTKLWGVEKEGLRSNSGMLPGKFLRISKDAWWSMICRVCYKKSPLYRIYVIGICFRRASSKRKKGKKAAGQRFQRRASHKSRSFRETEVAIEAHRAVLCMSVRMPGHVNKAKH